MSEKHTLKMPRNPYSGMGSMQEAWQRGFDRRPLLSHLNSDYSRAYIEGRKARAAIARATGEPK